MPLPWPTGFDSPVLESLRPVVEKSRHVRTHSEKIREHAGWMAYEELLFPDFLEAAPRIKSSEETTDFILLTACLNFAFTDFTTNEVFHIVHEGQRLSDAVAMSACLDRALDEGTPLLDGNYLRRIERAELEHIFRAPTRMPMLEERVEILRQIGETLSQRYAGRFHRFIADCPPRLYAGGEGVLERLVREFPRFNDTHRFDGHEVKIYKLAQLGLWMLHCSHRRSGHWQLEDIHRMTAFADYIVPMALRLMGILSYSPELAEAVDHWRPIARDSREEIETRAHTLYATALMTEEINTRRPPERRIIIPQLDARFWTHYHDSFTPHHLTRTIMY